MEQSYNKPLHVISLESLQKSLETSEAQEVLALVSARNSEAGLSVPLLLPPFSLSLLQILLFHVSSVQMASLPTLKTALLT
jgi:hypothetical protein